MYTGKIYAGKHKGKIVYIGQTTQELSKRVKQHISRRSERQKWSWVILKRLENTSLLSLWEELDNAERFYIKKFNTFHDGENHDAGGVPAEHRLEHLKQIFPDL